jgi:hypothetical protein
VSFETWQTDGFRCFLGVVTDRSNAYAMTREQAQEDKEQGIAPDSTLGYNECDHENAFSASSPKKSLGKALVVRVLWARFPKNLFSAIPPPLHPQSAPSTGAVDGLEGRGAGEGRHSAERSRPLAVPDGGDTGEHEGGTSSSPRDRLEAEEGSRGVEGRAPEAHFFELWVNGCSTQMRTAGIVWEAESEWFDAFYLSSPGPDAKVACMMCDV